MEQKKRLHSIRIYFDLLLAYTRGRDRISLDRKLEGAKKKFTRVRPYTHIYTRGLSGTTAAFGGSSGHCLPSSSSSSFHSPAREEAALALYTDRHSYTQVSFLYGGYTQTVSRACVCRDKGPTDRPTVHRCMAERERESGQCASGSLYFRSRSSSAICSRAISSGAGGGEKTRFGLF